MAKGKREASYDHRRVREKYRDNLYDALAKLRKAYDAVAQDQVEKQLKLI